MRTASVALELPAKAEYLLLARLALGGISRAVPIEEDVLADLKLAVTEACGNAVRHAYPADRGVVRVGYDVSPDRIVITVEDDGSGVPENAGTDDPLDAAEPPESGMGLAIIRAVVDELELEERIGGQGTVVRMTKRLG